MRKSLFRQIATLCTCALIFIACSVEPLPSVNINEEGIAIKGYDPVAYFTMDRPVKGLKEYQFEWNSAKWLFANKDHLAMFEKNPERFAPQYGGY